MDKIFNYNFEIIATIYAGVIWFVAFGVPIFVTLLFRAHGHVRLRKITIITCIAGWLTVIYGSFIEPRLIVINKQTIDLPKISQPITVALVSDLHYGPWKKTSFAKKTVEKIIEQNPNLVLIAGDVIYDKVDDLKYLEPWREIARRVPTYVALGNHEFNAHRQDWPPNLELAEATRKRLAELGVTALENKSAKISVRGAEFYLIGLGDIWVNQLNIDQAVANIEDGFARIALVHNPDAITEAKKYPIDLLLAGHTHGGQVRLPIIGPIGIIPTKLGQKYDKGWFGIGNTKMFITSGLGETTARARLFNPPEIVLLTIN